MVDFVKYDIAYVIILFDFIFSFNLVIVCLVTQSSIFVLYFTIVRYNIKIEDWVIKLNTTRRKWEYEMKHQKYIN